MIAIRMRTSSRPASRAAWSRAPRARSDATWAAAQPAANGPDAPARCASEAAWRKSRPRPIEPGWRFGWARRWRWRPAPPAKAPLPASQVAAVASRTVPVAVPVILAPRTAVAKRRARRSLPAQSRAASPLVYAGGTPALPAPQPAEEVAVAPALDFTPLATGFADQPAQRGAQAELAAWGGATPFQPIRSEAANAVLLAPSQAAPSRGG